MVKTITPSVHNPKRFGEKKCWRRQKWDLIVLFLKRTRTDVECTKKNTVGTIGAKKNSLWTGGKSTTMEQISGSNTSVVPMYIYNIYTKFGIPGWIKAQQWCCRFVN
jgi:hypothetical protein